jgi:hypothetical protein
MTEIFVFGSNLLGIHKKGAALTALEQYGAKLGRGNGLQGKSYAIPTKHDPRTSLDIVAINKFVADFLLYAQYTPHNCYLVTKIGCGLAGYKPEQIAPLFSIARELKNVKLPPEFIEFIPGIEISDETTTTFSGF